MGASGVRVAVSTALGPLLDGPPRTLTLAGTGPVAAYLTGDDGIVVAVTRPDAVVPPCGLVLPDGVRPDRLLPAGTTVLAGDGALTVTAAPPAGDGDGVTLRPGRWWSPPGVLPGHAPRRRWPAAAPPTLALLREHLAVADRTADPAALTARAAVRRAARHLAVDDPDAALRALVGVIGLGPGLTPSGDDVAAGFLLLLLATGHPDATRLGHELTTAARGRTTAVSAGLLAEAARGRAARPVAAVVHLLTGRADPTTRHALVRGLLTIGHHSGADLATGISAAAGLVAHPSIGYRRSA